MTAKFTIVVTPTLKAVQKRFKKAIKEMNENNTPYHQAATFVSRWVLQNFKGQGSKLSGRSWAPLKLGGRKKKKGKRRTKTGMTLITWGLDRTAKILQDTGRLRASFHPFVEASGRRVKQAGVRSDLPYAAPHQEGLGPLPQRRMLPTDSEVRDPIRKIFDRHLAKIAGRLKGRA